VLFRRTIGCMNWRLFGAAMLLGFGIVAGCVMAVGYVLIFIGYF